jgi:hypothetical protein
MNIPGIGDNTQTIDFAKVEVERLKNEYGYVKESAGRLIEQAKAITVIADNDDKSKVIGLIKLLRDEAKRSTGLHEIEKAPHFRRGQGVDQFFFGIVDRLWKRDKKGNDGEGDRLNKLLTAYDVRQLAIEEEKRKAAALEAARIAQAAEAERLRKEQEAEAARLAAERARKPDTTAAKAAIAAAAEEAAMAARVEQTATAAAAEEAYMATLAAPADIMRTRAADGSLATMAKEKFVEITDRNTLDLNKLRPYLPADALVTAIRKYAESVSFSNDESVQIAGAKFGTRPKSKVY